MTAGTYINDGTAVFILRDVRDGTPICRPIMDDILRDSYVKRNGALLQRRDYPTIVKFMQDNSSLVTTEANWANNKIFYTWGDGTSASGTTIRVPDDRGLYEQLSDDIGLVAAGLPNIYGNFSIVLTNPPHGLETNSATGSFSKVDLKTANVASTSPTGMVTKYASFGIGFSAQTSNAVYGNSITVTPPSIKRIAQMKY